MSEESPKGVQAYAVNRIGHAAGRKLAVGLWKQEWIRRLASKNPELMRIVSEGAIALTSMLELGGSSTLARLVNFIAESLSMESLELLEKFEQDPGNEELAKQVEKIGQDAGAKVDGNVVVALEHVHKDRACMCVVQYVADTTPPSRPGKDGKVFTNPSTARVMETTLSAALAAGKPLCGICYPALSIAKAEAKQETKAVTPGRNFMEHLMRLRKEDHEEFEKFWKAYLRRLEGPDGTELGRKFQDAFNGKHDYEAFRFVVGLPHRSETESEEWHHALDALLGKIEPPSRYKDIINGFLDKELKETEEMFRALFAWVKRGNDARAERIAAKKEIGRQLDEEWEAQRAARKTRKTVKKYVFIGLLVILASVYAVHRTTTPDRSASTEQKVESSNDH